MKTSRVITVVFLALAGTVLSQTVPSALPSSKSRQYIIARSPSTASAWHFQIGDQHYRAMMTGDLMRAGPDWNPSMPLPLSFAKAEGIARTELKKLVPGDDSWEVTDLELKRNEDQQKWYYVIRLKPGASGTAPNPDSFFAVMNLSGEVGTIEPDPNPSHR